MVTFIFYFPRCRIIYPGGDFTLSGLLDKPRSQVASFPPPRYRPALLTHRFFGIPSARRVASNFCQLHAHAAHLRFEILIYDAENKHVGSSRAYPCRTKISNLQLTTQDWQRAVKARTNDARPEAFRQARCGRVVLDSHGTEKKSDASIS